MRIPFLRPKPDQDSPPAAKPARSRARAAADEPGDVEAARVQARRRLVGAVVLLAIGIIGFPALFETQPRPLPMDTPIAVANRDGTATPQPREGSSPKPLPVTMQPADAGMETAPAAPVTASAPTPAPIPAAVKDATPTVASAGASATAASKPATAASAKPASAVTPVVSPASDKPAIKPADKAASKAVEQTAAKPADKPAPKPADKPAAPVVTPAPVVVQPSTPAASARFVVQAGAYTEAGKLRDARSKIEQLGIKTYTQVIETDKGSRTRVRVGPFPTRAEADAVAAKIKRTGLPAAIVAL